MLTGTHSSQSASAVSKLLEHGGTLQLDRVTCWRSLILLKYEICPSLKTQSDTDPIQNDRIHSHIIFWSQKIRQVGEFLTVAPSLGNVGFSVAASNP